MFVRTLTLLLLFVAGPALAQKRIALLIGNRDYTQQVGPLVNPINDVLLIAGALQKVGFKRRNVHIVKDGKRREILQAVDSYAERLHKAGSGAIGFLYYSGHGASIGHSNENYLFPIDVKSLDANARYDAIPLEKVISTLSSVAKNAAQFVVFDACRNVLKLRTKGTKGFSPVQSQHGMVIAFSTDPGETASDVGASSGPYARALAEELVKPGVHHLDLFQNVKEVVHRRTGGQVPWTRNGMLRRVYLNSRKQTDSQKTNERLSLHERPNEAGFADGVLNSFSGLSVELLYGRTADDLQAGQGLRKILRKLNARIVQSGQTPNLEITVKTHIVTHETIGSRHARATLTIYCNRHRKSLSCLSSPIVSNGDGVGQQFDVAIEKSIDAALHSLENKLRQRYR